MHFPKAPLIVDNRWSFTWYTAMFVDLALVCFCASRKDVCSTGSLLIPTFWYTFKYTYRIKTSLSESVFMVDICNSCMYLGIV